MRTEIEKLVEEIGLQMRLRHPNASEDTINLICRCYSRGLHILPGHPAEVLEIVMEVIGLTLESVHIGQEIDTPRRKH